MKLNERYEFMLSLNFSFTEAKSALLAAVSHPQYKQIQQGKREFIRKLFVVHFIKWHSVNCKLLYIDSEPTIQAKEINVNIEECAWIC